MYLQSDTFPLITFYTNIVGKFSASLLEQRRIKIREKYLWNVVV